MGRKNISHLRKPEILKHTYRLIEKEGLEGASITKIAKQMGVNSGIVMHYFKNKEELILALVDFMLDKTIADYRKFLDESKVPVGHHLETIIDFLLDPEMIPLRGSVFWACFALSFRNKQAKKAIQRMYQQFINTLIQYVTEAKEGNRIVVEDPELVAHVLLPVIEGAGYLKITMGDTPYVKQMFRYYNKAVRNMLGLPDDEEQSVKSDEKLEGFIPVSGIQTVQSMPRQENEPESEIRDRIIDLRLPVPPTAEDIATKLNLLLSDPKANGLANYKHIFGPKWAEQFGISIEELKEKLLTLSPKEAKVFLRDVGKQMEVTPSAFIKELDEVGIDWGMVFAHEDSQRVVDIVARYPDRLKGMALINPHESDAAVKTEQVIKELGFSAIYASPFHWKIHANDPKFFPIYAKASELGVPVFVYATMNYNAQLPMDLGRPIYLDKVAIDFPDLKIVASCGGWPWVHEMVGVARRHQNVYIDTSFHRPKHLATPGSGWEMLLQYGNTVLQDRIVFGSGIGDMGIPLSTIIREMKELPLKPSVKDKWLYSNAAQLFNVN